MSESRTSIIVGASAAVISGLLIFACVTILQVRDAVKNSNALAEELHAAIERNTELAASTNTHVIEVAANTSDHGWEYDVVSVPDLEWSSTGKQLGKEGWEIVSARRASGSDGGYLYECIVRRPVREASQGGDQEIERVRAELREAESALSEVADEAERARVEKLRDELKAELQRLESEG